MKKFYGIRFLGGNRTCTMGDPNPLTGRVSTACDIVAFTSRAARDEWVNAEKLTAPTGCGGGERLALRANRIAYHLRGMSPAERMDFIEIQEAPE